MRLGVISDTHFGDDWCTLVRPAGDEAPEPGPAYPALKKALGEVDFLVVLGDVLDFSVTSYENAYRQAAVFFRRIQKDRLARQIIYVPGNHDFDIWHTAEHQVNVINQLKQGQLPRAFKRTVPGVIDDRKTDPDEKFLLPDITPKPEIHEERTLYGNLFLDHITRYRAPGSKRVHGKKLTFNLAYPNLYLVTDAGDSVLLTHGHYFEQYWSLTGEWALKVAADDLDLEKEGELNLRELVGLNMPLNQLACTGIGQAQPLTDLVRALQMETVQGKTALAKKYFDRFEQGLKSSLNLSLLQRIAQRYALRWLERRILAILATTEQTRYSTEFLTRPSVRARFRKYFRHSLNEIERLRLQHGVDLPVPRHVVFGHTHQPIPWGTGELVDCVDDTPVHLCNTGGWLTKKEPDGSTPFPGAEVLLYESGKGVWSESIRGKDLAVQSPLAPQDLAR